MADPLYELLVPYFDSKEASPRPAPSAADPTTSTYLARLTTLPLLALSSSEQQSLSQSSQSLLRSLQTLSKKSHKSIISSSGRLANLRDTLPKLGHETGEVRHGIPKLESEALRFSEKYSKTVENPILDRRRKAMLLARNVDRVSDLLDLPTLLSSAISSSTAPSQAPAASTSTATNANYASALDLHAHIKRLHTLYPNLDLVTSISAQAEHEMKGMTTNLIASLQSQGIKLAGAMRTIGWLRRVAPELDEAWTLKKPTAIGSSEGALGALFLVCRLTNLLSMLEALDPLRELADQETARRTASGAKANGSSDRWSGGQQTERYLKRYIEIFREQSFAIISMYKSIFPAALPPPGSIAEPDEQKSKLPSTSLPADKKLPEDDTLQPLPSALATFPLHLVDLLFETLKRYLPNVQDRSSRDSLFTQVLYCAGSLGRLGGDFGMMLALLEEEMNEGSEDEKEEEEWVEVMKKHRIQASRLELLASGVGTNRTVSPSH
ncbi:Dor1-domain-containing protein [Mytilinidion resinicola]|uniref:Conserved oligomeric Golgi complex subunit 8 n=1 Tax=Mytilinidion resinicola TaxID=574789 RepID=A0A6A6Y891_9PEZI|nr:Dor1-domain-containing protein [Mytilinidion resinicola]KAF2805032.1 Dor1-domain-containing protein [Mytilinidion resinicola]